MTIAELIKTRDNHMNMMLDSNVVRAIKLYFQHGLPPGSFTSQLISGNYKTKESKKVLYYRAHPLLRHYVEDHIYYVENILPLCCKNLNKWKGYSAATLECKEEINHWLLVLSIKKPSLKMQLQKWIEDV